MDVASRLRAALADSLVAAGVLRDPRWEAAFRQVPRHVFLPGCFTQNRDGSWSAVRAGDRDHLSLVYRNDVCVTQLNGSTAAWLQAPGAVRGVPTSSSSMPTIMAIMLEALDLEPGSRVLEIGTGTGYNAALLSHFLGAGNVTSVDVDPDVLAAARTHLEAAGFAPTCALADGERGHPPAAPYTHVLGTCAVSRVPAAWLAQVVDGGVIVTTLNRPLGAGLLKLRVHEGTATGPVLQEDGRFMPLRAHTPTWADEALHRALADVPTTRRTTLLPARAVLDPASPFEFFAGLTVPGVVTALSPARLVHPDGSWVRHEGAAVAQGGPRALWTLLEEAHKRWHALRTPRRQDFTYTATSSAAHFTHTATGRTWPA
ncbi:methyltransferase domain-containing protein [Actinosynnema sp. NPDC020468]|uniref:methyltransferase domain-containing protein n=1 Tax=Actinosynnema sp. NPDC020468 TaxID=3154488 RepID=UPI0033E29124